MFTREDLDKIQKKVTPNPNEWVIKGNIIVYRDYVGKNGLLAKSAGEAMRLLFEEKQKEDITLQKTLKNIRLIKTERRSLNGYIYTEISFEANNLPLALTVINALTRDYRRQLKELNK